MSVPKKKAVLPVVKRKTSAVAVKKVEKKVAKSTTKRKVVSTSPRASAKAFPTLQTKKYIDGYSSQKTYLVVAEHPDGRKLAIRPCGDCFRVHAYPNFNDLGLTVAIGVYNTQRSQYQSCWVSKGEWLSDVLTSVRKARGFKALSVKDTAEIGL